MNKFKQEPSIYERSTNYIILINISETNEEKVSLQ